MGVPGIDGYKLFMLLTVHANCCWSYLSRHTTSRQYLLPDRVYKALRAGKCLVSFKGSMIPIKGQNNYLVFILLLLEYCKTATVTTATTIP